MALTRVQATAKVVTAGTSITIPLATPPTLGNAIIVTVWSYNSALAAATCADNKGNLYSLVASQQSGTANCCIFLCAKITATGASFTITASKPGAGDFLGGAVEVGGVGGGLVVDKTGTGAVGLGPAGVGTTTATAALANDEVFAVGVMSIQGTQSSITVGTATPTWTQEWEHLDYAQMPGEADTRILTGVLGTTQSISWTVGTGGAWCGCFAAFAATASTGSSISYLSSTSKVIGINGPVTTAAFDTTGATAILLSLAFNVNGVPVITDSKGNTYTGLTTHQHTSSWHRIYYCINPVVGTGHTITVNGSAIYASLWAAAFAGVSAYAGLENGAIGSASPVATGSVTPSLNGSLVFTGLCGNAATDTFPSGYTGLGTVPFSSGINYQNSAAYLIQGTAAATNPSWAWTGGARTEAAVSVAVFAPTTPAASVRATQAVVETLSLPVPVARVTQDVVEILAGGTSSLAVGRVTQALIEILQQSPPPTDARITQALIEILRTSPPPVRARVTQLALDVFYPRTIASYATQLAVEVFFPRTIPARFTQAAIEYFTQIRGHARDTQLVVEVFLRLPPCTTGAFPIDTLPAGGSCPVGGTP